MSSPKTITIREHVAEIERREREWGAQNMRQTALEYASRNRREIDNAGAIIKSAEAYEKFLVGKKRR